MTGHGGWVKTGIIGGDTNSLQGALKMGRFPRIYKLIEERKK
jgi:hypothetical protein